MLQPAAFDVRLSHSPPRFPWFRLSVHLPGRRRPQQCPESAFIDDGSDITGSGIEIREFPICNQYTIQGDEFSKAIREDREVPVPLEDAIANMTVIDAVFRSAKTAQWERP